MSRNRTGQAKHDRFSPSIMTLSLRGRLVVTAPVFLVGVFLFLNVIADARADDPRPAALVFFLFGIWAFVSWRFLRHLWRPNIDWAAERRDASHRSEHVTTTIEELPQTHLNFLTFHQDVASDQADSVANPQPDVETIPER